MEQKLDGYGFFEIFWNSETWKMTVSVCWQGAPEPLVFDFSDKKGGDETAVPRRFLAQVLPYHFLSDPDGDIGLGNYELNRDGIKCACDALMSVGYLHCVATEVAQELLYSKAQEALAHFNEKKIGGK